MAKRWTKTTSNGPLRYFEAHIHDKTPHWKRYGNGCAHLKITSHDLAKWLEFDTDETSFEPGKRATGKRTMFSLDETAARDLYAFLHSIYGEAKP